MSGLERFASHVIREVLPLFHDCSQTCRNKSAVICLGCWKKWNVFGWPCAWAPASMITPLSWQFVHFIVPGFICYKDLIIHHVQCRRISCLQDMYCWNMLGGTSCGKDTHVLGRLDMFFKAWSSSTLVASPSSSVELEWEMWQVRWNDKQWKSFRFKIPEKNKRMRFICVFYNSYSEYVLFYCIGSWCKWTKV